MAKRYYWLKLKDDFFLSKRIKKLRSMAGGDTYTIIYLKMLLSAMKTDGVLTWTGVENNFAEELALDFDEETDNVETTICALIRLGLAETDNEQEYFFPYVVENTGSEGASAARVRKYRNQRALQRNKNVTERKREEIERRDREEIEIEKREDKLQCNAVFPLGDGSEYVVECDYISELQKNFPGIDIPGELQKMVTWCIENPKTGKRAEDVRPFIERWLARTQREETSNPFLQAIQGGEV